MFTMMNVGKKSKFATIAFADSEAPSRRPQGHEVPDSLQNALFDTSLKQILFTFVTRLYVCR